jgi:ParB family chromosome partitioning protein
VKNQRHSNPPPAQPPARPAVRRWPISSLRPHPSQAKFFAPLTEVELQALADDLRANGQRQPIEILPDNSIICGHQRVAAAKLLGWDEMDVVVREDLAQADEWTVEQHLINDNLVRRQMSELDVARCVRHLRQGRGSKRAANGQGNWRDEVGKRFGVSGRTVARWERLLGAPLEIQQAFSAKKLTLSEALVAALLPRSQQQELVDSLKAGEEPKAVLRAFKKRPAAKSADASQVALDDLLKHLQWAMERLGNRRARLAAAVPAEAVDLLTAGKTLLARLIQQAEPAMLEQ